MQKTTGLPGGAVRFAHLNEQQYAQGVELATSSGLASEYGERFAPPGRTIDNPWGRYITLFDSGELGDLEALLVSLDG
jgi:hypothetical protein